MRTRRDDCRSWTGQGGHALLVALVALALSGCKKEEAAAPPPVRLVRTVVVEARSLEDSAVVTGHVRARDEVNLAFRLSGKLIERRLEAGDRVEAGQTVARLDRELEQSARDAAEAEVRAAQATLDEAELSEARKNSLLAVGAVSKTEYDIALRQLKTARASLEAAKARLKSAEDQLGYTELKSETAGLVTQTGAKAGEVVQAGQMILKVAQQTGRDAIFDMPAWIIREGLGLNHEVRVVLSDNEAIWTTGRVREISPQADPVTRNYEVKVELADPPEGMFLGATVTGVIARDAQALVQIPSTAMTMLKDKPAVWVLDGEKGRVARREVVIERYTPQAVLVREGLQPDERVVTAGVQELHEGQAVKALGGAT